MIPKECKRLAEVDFPIAVVSKHSAREKLIRHGHPSTLHLWWARRPLAACRAMLMALLLPDPCDPHCPADFKSSARALLTRPMFSVGAVKTDEDLRRAILKFIGDFADWDNSSNPVYLEIGRGLVKAALPEETPLVVDPDPRSRHGRRHPLCAIIGIGVLCCAIMCGARSYAAIARWAEAQLPAEPADRQTQSIDEALVVGVVVEDPLAHITPAHDMIDGARVLDSQWPAHSYRLTPRERCVNRKPDLTLRHEARERRISNVKPLIGTLWVTNPARQSWTSSRKQVLRGGG